MGEGRGGGVWSSFTSPSMWQLEVSGTVPWIWIAPTLFPVMLQLTKRHMHGELSPSNKTPKS